PGRGRQAQAVPADEAPAADGAPPLMYEDLASGSRARRTFTGAAHLLFALQLDGPLVAGLGLIAALGLVVLYSALGQRVATVVRTELRLPLGIFVLVLLGHINPNFQSSS